MAHLTPVLTPVVVRTHPIQGSRRVAPATPSTYQVTALAISHRCDDLGLRAYAPFC